MFVIDIEIFNMAGMQLPDYLKGKELILDNKVENSETNDEKPIN